MPATRQPIAERFWQKVEKGPDCWNWTAAIDDDGYGRVGAGGKHGGMRLASRVSWEIHSGAIPTGIHVLHRCDNPRCVNPKHLFLGTQKDNIQDCVRKGRHNGGNPRLLPEQVVEIRKRCAAGEKQVVVAKSFGISTGHISEIIGGRKWISQKS